MNGKSLLVDLFQECLGDYSCVLPITLLTENRAKAGQAQPELFVTKGKRFAVLQEPDTKTAIQVGLLKELTGGDKIIARTLFKEPIEFKPQFKMILTCNDLPKLPPHDQGTWRRVRATEFVSKFTSFPALPPPPMRESEDVIYKIGLEAVPEAWICAPCKIAIYALTPTGSTFTTVLGAIVKTVPAVINNGPVIKYSLSLVRVKFSV